MKAVCLHCPELELAIAENIAWLAEHSSPGLPCPKCGRPVLAIRATFILNRDRKDGREEAEDMDRAARD